MRRPRSRWATAPPPDDGAARSLAAVLSVPLALGRLLVARGHDDPERAQRFLRPALEHLHDPALLRDLPEAVARLSRAIRAGETVLVHGDYDVDGICSTALMVRTIRSLGGVALPFIPDRRTDGYDLGPAGVHAARAAKAALVLTCDCGTTAHESADALAEAGIDLIVSDHHLPGASLPRALAVVNPRRGDDASPDKDLAAAGVAYKLALSLVKALGGNAKTVLDALDLVALATVADVASLRGENRVFVRHGLALVPGSRSPGVRALVRSAGLEGKEITAGRVGYILAPRLNALGRLDRAIKGVELLLAEREDEALAIARLCEEKNRERQALDRRILDEAMRRVERLDLDETYGIVLADEGWHAGVIGIVASRVVEQTARPVFLIAVQDGVGKGSGRSIPALDLHAALGACGHLLMKHGGHHAAAGLTVEAGRIPEFTALFNDVARARLSPDDFVRELRVDLELPLAEATDDLERLLRHLEPFGVGNPGPLFLARGVRAASSAVRIGADGVKLLVEAGERRVEAVGWGLADRVGELREGALLDLAYKLDRNEYRGRSTLQLAIVDFRPAE
ncbi:MAG TPA: single-stranded-DNA-specific exonuclease RecJ [Gemmatimonadaceae bacterium]|nr:single-stranded-DNA-specific exonuclease RecJ [Gemmatimonadaceae bacterium]